MNFLRRTPSIDPDAGIHRHHRGQQRGGKVNTNSNAINNPSLSMMPSRDPPDAASVVLSSSIIQSDTTAPTFSLNARQMEILANRQQQQQQQQQQRPFVTTSNQNDTTAATAALLENDKRQQQQQTAGGSYDRYHVPGAAGASSVVGSTTSTARTAPTDQRATTDNNNNNGGGRITMTGVPETSTRTQSDTTGLANNKQNTDEQRAFLRNMLAKAATATTSATSTTSTSSLQPAATLTMTTTASTSSFSSARPLDNAADQKAILRRVLKRTEKTLHSSSKSDSSKYNSSSSKHNKKTYIPIMATPPPPPTPSSVVSSDEAGRGVDRTDTATTTTDSSIVSESASANHHHHLSSKSSPSKSSTSSISGISGTWGTTVNGLRERLRNGRESPNKKKTRHQKSIRKQQQQQQQAKQQSASSSSEERKILADMMGGGKKKPSTTTTTREERKVLSEILSSKKKEAGPAAVSEERRLLKELLARSKKPLPAAAAAVKRNTATTAATTIPNPYASLGRSMDDDEEEEKKEESLVAMDHPSFNDSDDDDTRLQQLPPKARLAEMRKRLEQQKVSAAATKTATSSSSSSLPIIMTTTRDPPPTKVKTIPDDADLEGYENFYKTLQLEVSGQHSQLWASFSAVLEGRQTPALLAVPPPAKSFKFDPETKLMLTKMNGYLKDYAPVECKTQTQLVNDKKLAKQIASGALPAPLVGLRSAGPLSLSTTSKPGDSSVASATIADDNGSDAVLRMRSSTTSTSSHSSTTASPGQQQHRFFASPHHQPSEEASKPNVASAPPPPPPPPRYDERENSMVEAKPTTVVGVKQASSADSIGNSSVRNHGLTSSRGLLGCATWSGRASSKAAAQVVGVATVAAVAQEKKSKASIASSTLTETGCASDFENQSDPGLEVTLGQFVSKTSTLTSSRPSTPSETGSVTSSFSRLQLKSVKSFSSSHVDNTNVSPSTIGGGLPPAWATVRLRKVDLPPEPNNNQGQQDDTNALLPPPPPPPPPTQDSIELNRSSSCVTAAVAASSISGSTQMQADVQSSDGTAISSKIYGEGILSMESADNETATTTREERTQPLETIDGSIGQTVTTKNSETFDALTSTVTHGDGRVRDKIDEAVVVRLKQSPGTPTSVEMRVIIGKKMLMMVRGKVGQAQATVLWKLPRSDSGALTLDMASYQAKLMVKDRPEEKILSFSCPEDCLKFANAFYEMEIPRSPKEVDDSLAGTDAGDDDDGDAEFASLRLERLNNEEQAVLDTYRRLRKNKPAGDALQETISQEGSINGDMLLTPEENDIADKYRKMLKVSIPLDAVKHKMLRDDVHAKIIDVVVTEAENTPPRVVSTEPMPSSPISTFSNSILLSPQEVLIAENFKKMLRLQIPADAIRLEMKKQNIDAKIVEFVLGEDASSNSLGTASTSVNLTEAEKLAVVTYEKMLKMCIPAEAVRHKMKQDQADVKIVEAVFGKGSGEDFNTAPVGSTNKLSKEEEEIAAKYRHMLKMHIPKEAVEHKMTKEGIGQKIMSAVLGDGVAIPAPITAGFKANTKKDLTADELSIASQFKKMLKLQIPRDKVLERMQQENIDEKIVAFVLGKSAQALTGDANSKSSNKNSSKLVSLHWTPLSGKELDNSVWKAAGNRKVTTAEPEGNDISKLVELFQKKTNKAAKKEKKATANSDTSEKAKLLDLNRSNNIAISLKAFKDFEFVELAEIIMHLDPMRKIQGERVHFLRDLLPTQTEIKIIKSYDGSPSRLVPAELWFQSIADIKRIEVKVQVLRTMEMLKVEAKSIGENLRLLTLVCNQVMDSEKLQDLLGMVLRIGNIMNEGTRTGGAAGFKFDSLLKLTQTKSSDGKTTVLDYLVTVFVAKNKRDTLDLTSEFPECQTASRMLVSDLVAEVKSIQESLEQCKEELAALEEDAIGRKAGRFTSLQAKASDLSSQSSTVSDSRAGLLASIQRRPSIVDIPDRDVVSDPSCRNIELPVNPEALLADSANEKATNASSVADLLKSAASQMEHASQDCSRRRLSAMNGNSGVFGAISRIESVSKNNVHAAVARLRDFIAESDLLVEKLVAEKDETMAASRELARYCGESAGPGATSILLGILSGFASSLEEALKKHDQKRLAEEKRKKRREEERTAAQAKGPQIAVVESVDSSESEETGASLVLMVNQMLKDANPRAKEDFKKGRVAHNPSQTLQKIYETEQKVTGYKSHNRKLDLVSAIQERSDEVDQGEVQIARSKFGSPLGTEDAGDTNMFRENKCNSLNRVRPRPENAEHRNVGHPENQPQRNVPSERPNPKPEGHRQKPSPDGFQRKQSPPNPEMSRPSTNKPLEPQQSPATNQSANYPPEEIEATTTYKTLRERIKSFASRNAADANHQEAGAEKGSSPPAAKEVKNSQEEKAVEEKPLSVVSDEKTEESAKVDVPETLHEPKAQDIQLDHPQFDISGSSHRLSLNGIATPERQIPKTSNAIQRLEQSRVVSEVKIVGLAPSMPTYDKDADLTIASPPRIPSTAKSDNPKSLRELAMEKRQQRNSSGKTAREGEDQDASIDSMGESPEITAVNASGESTVARMARIKREEKAQQKQQAVAAAVSLTTTKSATVQPLPTSSTSRGQSLVKGLVQMAREKREAKKNTPT